MLSRKHSQIQNLPRKWVGGRCSDTGERSAVRFDKAQLNAGPTGWLMLGENGESDGEGGDGDGNDRAQAARQGRYLKKDSPRALSVDSLTRLRGAGSSWGPAGRAGALDHRRASGPKCIPGFSGLNGKIHRCGDDFCYQPRTNINNLVGKGNLVSLPSFPFMARDSITRSSHFNTPNASPLRCCSRPFSGLEFSICF